MLFSSDITFYRCSQCEAEYSDVVPKSIFPTIVTCVVAGAFWARSLEHLFGETRLFFVVGFIIAAFELWAIYEITERISNAPVRNKQCERCRGELAPVGRGFYDGMMPNLWELAIYVVTILIAALGWWVTKHV